MTDYSNKFNTVNACLTYFTQFIKTDGIDVGNTKALYNIGFYIYGLGAGLDKEAQDRADALLGWYDRKDYDVNNIHNIKLREHLKVGKDIRQNYGILIGDQFEYIIKELKNKDTRRAVVSIYDGMMYEDYAFDTPCTLNLHFQIVDNRLCLSVMMRSNNFTEQFKEDFYIFTTRQKRIAEKLGIETHRYYHFVTNLHIYNK